MSQPEWPSFPLHWSCIADPREDRPDPAVSFPYTRGNRTLPFLSPLPPGRVLPALPSGSFAIGRVWPALPARPFAIEEGRVRGSRQDFMPLDSKPGENTSEVKSHLEYPHPNPLPAGEGESGPACTPGPVNSRADALSGCIRPGVDVHRLGGTYTSRWVLMCFALGVHVHRTGC